MAGPLTWRNVEAPDFRSAMQGYQIGSTLIGDALKNAQGVLGGIRAEQGRGVDQEILRRSLALQDPAAARAAMADGSLLGGLNLRDASSDVLSGLQGRVGTLLNQATSQQNLDQTGYLNTRTRDLNARSDAASPAINALADAAQRGDQAAVDRIRSENAGVLGNLTGDQAMAVASGTQGLTRGELQQRQGEFGLGRDRYNLSIGKRDDAEGRAAQQLTLAVARRSANGDDAAASIEASDASPQVKAMALAGIQRMYPGTYGAPVSSAPGTAGTSAGSPFDTVVGFGQFGNSQKPITSMTLGEAVDFGKNVLIPGTRGNAQLGLSPGQGSSAMGAYQITQGTLNDYGPKVFGKDWKSTPMTAENQDKIAEALFNDRKGGNLKETWTSLPNSTPGNYANAPWERVRDLITQGEVGSPVSQMLSNATLRQGAGAAQMTAAARLSQNLDTGISPDYGQTLGDTRDVGAVADELIGENGSLAGSDRREVVKQLTRVMNDGNTNAATAGAVLRRNIQAGPGSLLSPGGALEWAQYGVNRALSPFESSPNLGNGVRLNDDGIKTAVNELRNGTALNQVGENVRLAGAQQAVTGAQEALSQAQAAYRQQVQMSQTRPAMKENLPRYEAQVKAAQQRLQQALMAFGQNPDNLARFQGTEPESPVAAGVSAQAASEGVISTLRGMQSGSLLPGFR